MRSFAEPVQVRLFPFTLDRRRRGLDANRNTIHAGLQARTDFQFNSAGEGFASCPPKLPGTMLRKIIQARTLGKTGVWVQVPGRASSNQSFGVDLAGN